MPLRANVLGSTPAKTLRDGPDTVARALHPGHQLKQTRRTLLGAHVVLEIGDAEDQAMALALPVESDQPRIPAEPALMPSVGQRVGVFPARGIQQEYADDRPSQDVAAEKTDHAEHRRPSRAHSSTARRRYIGNAILAEAWFAHCLFKPGCRAIGTRRVSRLTRSTWRETPDFVNTFCKCVRTVLSPTPSELAASARVRPANSSPARRVSDGVYSNDLAIASKSPNDAGPSPLINTAASACGTRRVRMSPRARGRTCATDG